MHQDCLNIYFKSSLKDSIVDMLLEDGYNDFFYIPCAKYASSSLLTSAKEQVSGRQEYGLFQLFLEAENAKMLANKMLQMFDEKSIKIFVNTQILTGFEVL